MSTPALPSRSANSVLDFRTLQFLAEAVNVEAGTCVLTDCTCVGNNQAAIGGPKVARKAGALVVAPPGSNQGLNPLTEIVDY